MPGEEMYYGKSPEAKDNSSRIIQCRVSDLAITFFSLLSILLNITNKQIYIMCVNCIFLFLYIHKNEKGIRPILNGKKFQYKHLEI